MTAQTVIATDLLDLFDKIAEFKGNYPPELLAARRAAFVQQIHEHDNPLESRLAAIDNALGEINDRETVNNLLEEKAEILTALEARSA
jgi:hypothetical protein